MVKKAIADEDVSSSGLTAAIDAGEGGRIRDLHVGFNLSALSGGSSPDVTPYVVTSEDGTTYFLVETASAALDAAAESWYTHITKPLMRYVKVGFTATGSATTATGQIQVNFDN